MKEKTLKKGGITGKKVLLFLLAICVLLAGIFFVYVGKYYKADETAFSILQTGGKQIQDTKEYIAFGDPSAALVGYVFYPGAKVEAEAYAPYLWELSEQGIFSVVVKPPFHLAIFDSDAAKKPMENYPGIQTWFVGGHSLGGVVAASYAQKHQEISGLILLASYPNVDLSQTQLPVLSLTASNDTVLNWEHYEAAKVKLPGDTVYKGIDGGVHGQFGSYGVQKGDGIPVIPPEKQWKWAANESAAFIGGKK